MDLTGTSESVVDRQIAQVVSGQRDFRGWFRGLERINGCAAPVYLVGHSITRDARTGEVVHAFTSGSQPGGRLMVPCGNRRASRCEPCAWLHAGDTYQVIVSGLAGGKGVPATVSGHPRLFVTLTAPSFGAVHRVSESGPCRRGRQGRRCAHGVGLGCVLRHGAEDPAVGSPLCPACYDYDGAVLWNAHAGRLWDDFAKRVRRHLASAVGVSRSRLGALVRVSFAKVAEYQRRGAVHLHAVLRLDGRAGPGEVPPEWASAGLLAGVVREAAGSAVLSSARPDGSVMVLRFGRQLDVQPIQASAEEDGGPGLSASAVAGYVAKYVTKGDVPGLVLDAPVRSRGHIEASPLGAHGRTLALACWDLGGLPEYEGLLLRSWAHQLGWRGHVATKSRAYSTTYGALHQARADFRRAASGALLADGQEVVTVASWSVDQVGHGSPGEAVLAAGVVESWRAGRELAREVALG